ncbi:hypothetical protein [[Clostridium] symbiosum]|uniref:hypothetical protein n=1 Tax=Clostridium symbiosum TaxID=1512 RepID=UPI0034A2E5F9
MLICTYSPFGSGSLALTSGFLPSVSGSLSSVSGSFPAVSGSLSSVSGSFPAVSGSLSSVSGSFPAVSGSLSSVSGSFPAVPDSLSSVSGSFPAVPDSLSLSSGSLLSGSALLPLSSVLSTVTSGSGSFAGGETFSLGTAAAPLLSGSSRSVTLPFSSVYTAKLSSSYPSASMVTVFSSSVLNPFMLKSRYFNPPKDSSSDTLYLSSSFEEIDQLLYS